MKKNENTEIFKIKIMLLEYKSYKKSLKTTNS